MVGTATGVAMPKKIAISRRRPEGAPDGCKIVGDLSQDFVRITRVLPIADASQMICD